MSPPALILASASTSRQRVLAAAGVDFIAIASDVDEDRVKLAARVSGVPAAGTALELAERKARSVAARHPQALVIGADQILVSGGRWFDKPPDLDAARTQLRSLRGREHLLETALVCVRGSQCVWRHVSSPALTMRDFSDAFLEAYLAAERDDVLGSVGAYRLEGRGAQLFARIDGDFFAILGLPLLPLLDYLRQEGLLPA